MASLRKLLTLGIVLGVGMGLGAGLELYLQSKRLVVPPVPEEAPQAVLPAPIPAPKAAEGLACEAEISFSNHLYPSLMLSFGAINPDFTRCLVITVSHAVVGKAVQVRVDSNLLVQPMATEVTAPSNSFTIKPELPWNYDLLRRNDQLRPETMIVTVVGEGNPVQTVVPCLIHPVNEVVSRLRNPETGDWQDTSVCYAAFVNEDHPLINELLREAEARGPITHFTGYGAGPQSVVEQMKAVWETVAARGLTYVDLATTSGGTPNVSTQYVRFLDQTIRDQGANCVDASVMLASIFRRIGLRPVLFFRPGHCFLAVFDSAQGGQVIALETTILGQGPFSAGISAGTEELTALQPVLGSPGCSQVDIDQARLEGVKPIEYVATP